MQQLDAEARELRGELSVLVHGRVGVSAEDDPTPENSSATSPLAA